MHNFTLNRTAFIHRPDSVQGCLSDVMAHLHNLRDCYPNFDDWMKEKVMPGLLLGERSILVEYRNDQLAGFAIVKDDGFEKKLCCLRVLDEFQNSRGMGVRLFERAFDELGTDKPLLSVSEERFADFARLFKHFGFQMAKAYEGIYRPGKIEYAFNGLLRNSFEEESIYFPSSLRFAEQLAK